MINLGQVFQMYYFHWDTVQKASSDPEPLAV